MKWVKQVGLYFLLVMATALMGKMVSIYASLDPTVAFLAFKQAYIENKIWKISFYVHVFFSVFTLLAGFTQFSPFLLVHYRNWHRWLGKIYVGLVLFINVPSGFVLAIYANGLWPSKLAFIILDLLWFIFTLKALWCIRTKDFVAHKNYMIRSYALTLSAITLRTWKLILTNFTELDVQTIYMVDAWLGFIPNLIFVELFIIKTIKIKSVA